LILEKKGEFEDLGLGLLRNINERELFYLNNGLTVRSLRDLIVQLELMDNDSFSHYVYSSKNEFVFWAEHVFKDFELALKLKQETSKEGSIRLIKSRLYELERRSLKKFGIDIPINKIVSGEDYILDRLSKGDTYSAIRTNLIENGWSSKVLDIMLEGDFNPYSMFSNVQNIPSLNAAQKNFKELKAHIINGVSDGLPLKEILDYLKNQGWSKEILEFVMLNAFKPHHNITKLSWFIIKQIGDNNKDIFEVKNSLIKIGWQNFIVENLIHGVRPIDNNIDRILNYVNNFDDEKKFRIKDFLEKNGWDVSFIEQAIKNKTINEFWNYLAKSLGLSNSESLRYNAEIFSDSIIKIKSSANSISFWKELFSGYRRINPSSFINNNGELHADQDYIYYYDKKDVDYLLELSKKGMFNKLILGTGVSFYYSAPIKPLLCEIHKSKFIISSKIIHKNCVSCNGSFTITKMAKVEIWNATRTQKVIKFVCKQHEKLVNTLMTETKLVQ